MVNNKALTPIEKLSKKYPYIGNTPCVVGNYTQSQSAKLIVFRISETQYDLDYEVELEKLKSLSYDDMLNEKFNMEKEA